MSQPRSAAEAGPSTGGARLRLLFSYASSRALSRQGPEEQFLPVHEELNSWATDTLLAACTGVAVGALYQWMENGKAVASAEAVKDAARAQALAKGGLARIRTAGIKGGLRLGGLAAVYYGVGMLAAVYLNRHDVISHTMGSAASAALLGYSLHRIRGAALGGAIGAALGVPSGLLWDKGWKWMPGQKRDPTAAIFQSVEAQKPTGEASTAPASKCDAAAAVLAQLEASLSGSGSQQQGAHQVQNKTHEK